MQHAFPTDIFKEPAEVDFYTLANVRPRARM